MNKAQKALSAILLAGILLLIVLLPKYAGRLLDSPSQIDWLRPRKEPFSGTVSVWHIIDFRPHHGSMLGWLKKYASKVEKRHFGVYFNVEALSLDEAEKRIANGETADVVSFPSGALTAAQFAPLTDGMSKKNAFFCRENDSEGKYERAVPLAASCELILYYPDKLEAEGTPLDAEKAAEHELSAFKTEKAPFCAADARAAGDMERLVQAGKARPFEALPYKKDAELVQFAGLCASIAQEKRIYAEELISLLLSEGAQTELAELGLLPSLRSNEASFERDYLSKAYGLILNGGAIAEPFSKRAE